jgi:hypothetical protein
LPFSGTHNPVAVNEPKDCCLAALYRHTTFGYSCGAASGNRKDITRRVRWRDFNLRIRSRLCICVIVSNQQQFGELRQGGLEVFDNFGWRLISGSGRLALSSKLLVAPKRWRRRS